MRDDRLAPMSPIHATFTMKVCLALLVLAAFAGVVLLTTRKRHQAARIVVGVALTVISAVWLRIDKPIEGAVLKSLSKRHGLTVADLVVFPCLAVAAGLLWAAYRDREARPSLSPRLTGETREI